MEIGGLLLAAGAGRRYGMPKALASHDGETLVRRGAATLAAAGCSPVLVVIGAAADDVRAIAPELSYVDNPEWATGMGSSLRAGLAAFEETTADAVVVLLVDMPGVTADAVKRVARHAAPGALVMGGYGDRRGHPVVLGREHWKGVASTATGDWGARDYLRAHADRLRIEPVGDVADDFDLDVPHA